LKREWTKWSEEKRKRQVQLKWKLEVTPYSSVVYHTQRESERRAAADSEVDGG
jgi:hypothetical protein